jgi:Fe-S cluster assembly protein SufD
MAANRTNDLAQAPALADLTGTYLADASRAAGEPDWLIEWRLKAWEYFGQAAPPQWRRTDLTALDPTTLHPLLAPQGTAMQWDEALAEQGVIFTSLATAVRDHGEQVRAVLGTGVDPLTNKFSALRAALWHDGVFLHVPRNVEVSVPLRVCYTLADGSQALFPYTLIVLEDNARVTFIEEFASRDVSEQALVGPTSEIFAGPGSEVRFISVQQNGAGVHHIGGQEIVFARDASAEWVSINLGSQVQHIEAEARMQGDGSRINWYGATFANAQQQLVIAPWLRHIAGHTETHMDFKTVVTDKAYSVFDGMIKIEHESRATTTRLEEHAIHLTSHARSDSIPGLMIDTNDVASAGHASTSGEVDAEQLFYMQSRGISRADAIHMIVMGFFAPALNAIPLEELRDTLVAAIEEKI